MELKSFSFTTFGQDRLPLLQPDGAQKGESYAYFCAVIVAVVAVVDRRNRRRRRSLSIGVVVVVAVFVAVAVVALLYASSSSSPASIVANIHRRCLNAPRRRYWRTTLHHE